MGWRSGEGAGRKKGCKCVNVELSARRTWDVGRTGERKEVVRLSRRGHDRGGPLLFRVMPSSEERTAA